MAEQTTRELTPAQEAEVRRIVREEIAEAFRQFMGSAEEPTGQEGEDD